MTRYIVFEPPAVSREESASGRDTVFVRDAFSIWAFIFTFLWLFYHRLWLAGGVALLLVLACFFLDTVPGFSIATAIIEIGLGILVALEGPNLRASKLRRRGWRESAALYADDRNEAEIMYYAGKVSSESAATNGVALQTQAANKATSAGSTRPKSATWPRFSSRTGGFFDTAGSR